ncbi:hypothetical protein BB560_000328 [Smittium megazygosporum]|uniref:Uncharacterized protein n=1 Tax=Smittium megazygosporum TaxID=133381 RepID=A0A2T9ZKT3_9FUNG|nr:hypothetical protein BB560_000328 [Smittium megazygosporum]
MADVYKILSEIQNSDLSCSPNTNNDNSDDNALQANSDPFTFWLQMFCKFFINDIDAEHDDMLFYVRNATSKNESNIISVVRKPDSPQLFSKPLFDVCWKESLFLNLISQMKCTLTISINRTIDVSFDPESSFTVRTLIKKDIFGLPNRPQSSGSSQSPQFSWPFIFFTFEDFSDTIDTLSIRSDEFLSIELSTLIHPSLEHTSSTASNPIFIRRYLNHSGKFASGSNDFFRSPKNDPAYRSQNHTTSIQSLTGKKSILFKRIVSFDLLSEIYSIKRQKNNILSKFRKQEHSLELISLKNSICSGHLQLSLKGSDFLKDGQEQSDDSDQNQCYKSEILMLQPIKYLKISHLENRSSSVPTFCLDDRPNVLSPGSKYMRPVKNNIKTSSYTRKLQSERSIPVLNRDSRSKSKTLSFSNQPDITIPLIHATLNTESEHGEKALEALDSLKRSQTPGLLPKQPTKTQSPAIESLSKNKNTSLKRPNTNRFGQWIQKLRIPLVSENLASSAKITSPITFELNIKYISIPWDDIIRTIFTAKNSFDTEFKNHS